MPIRRLYKSERFLRIIFGASLFVVLCMGGLAYKYIHDLSDSFKMVEHTYEVQLQLQHTLSTLKDAETGERGFLISKDSIFLLPYISSKELMEGNLVKLTSLTSDDSKQQENIEELKTKIQKRMVLLEQAMEMSKYDTISTSEFAKVLKDGRQTMISIRFKVNEMINYENELLKGRKAKSTESLSNAPLLVYYVLIFSLLLLLLTYAQISKNLKILRDQNNRLQTFKESVTQSEIVSNYGNWIWYIDSNTYEYSDNVYRLLGERPQSFEPKLENFMEFVHPEDVVKLKEQVAQMMVEENLPFIYYRIIQKNGKIKHFKGYAKVVINTDGDRMLLGTIADITEEMDNFRLIEERNLELERNNKELESFNYVASHDLQEPLRKIQTFISRLEDKESDNFSGNGKLYVERIKSSATRMRTLIDDLLQFSRTNTSEDVMEVTNMNLLLQSAKQDLAEIINSKKAKITTDIMPPMRVIPFQLKQLFQNLISNSLKYSQENVAPIIHVGYSKTKMSDIPGIKSTTYKFYHTISVTDNGIGFDQDYADKIFVLFSRLHAKNEYSGTGIGLSICKKIVENHQGYIFAKSEQTHGATFTIYLPFN
ncbi:MAG: sensor histidine kinase [Aquaticitalea sp.]